jgi:hypothetical protein
MASDSDKMGADAAPAAELVVLSVEQSGLMSSQVVVTAKHGFDFVVDRSDGLTHPFMNSARMISIQAGDTFHLMVSRRFAQTGLTIPFGEVSENPAFHHLWTSVESSRKRRWWEILLWI